MKHFCRVVLIMTMIGKRHFNGSPLRLDSIGGKRFIFVGIQKKSPYDLFFFDASNEKNFIETGRKKYKALLRKWKEEVGKTIDFVPSTWEVRKETLSHNHNLLSA